MATQLNRPARRLVALTGLVAALLLAGCGGLGGAEATPLPTRTPLPTFTPTPEGGPPAAPSQTDTQAQPPAEAATQPPAGEAAATRCPCAGY